MTDSIMSEASPKKVVKKGTAKAVKKRSTKKPTTTKDGNAMDVDDDEQGDDGGQSDADSEASGTLYCDCRGVDDHTIMITCDACGEWYHARCYGIRQHDASFLLVKFFCKSCQAVKPELMTVFKALCRISYLSKKGYPVEDCREPARTFDNGFQEALESQYCSDEHRTKAAELMITRTEDRIEPSLGGVISTNELALALKGTSTAAEFKALGKRPEIEVPADFDYSTIFNDEEIQIVAGIHDKRATLRERLIIWNYRETFFYWAAKKAAKMQAEAEGTCGYTKLFAVNEPEFIRWKESPEGVKTFEDKAIHDDTTFCKLTSCRKHKNWYNVHEEKHGFNKDLINEELDKLDKKEAEMKSWARTRVATAPYKN